MNNNSSIINHGLIKRRYSVPETVIRKHKLRETTSKSKSIDVCTTSTEPAAASSCHESYSIENKLKDESCQTDSIKYASSHRPKRAHISSKCRRRDGGDCVRCFKKCGSYCQYRKRAQRDRHDQPMSQSYIELPPIENRRAISQHANVTQKSNSDWSLDDSNGDGGATVFRAHSYPPRSFLFSTRRSKPSLDALDCEETLNLLDRNMTSKRISQRATTNVYESRQPSTIPHSSDTDNKSVDPDYRYDTLRENSAVDQTASYRDDNFKNADNDVFPITFHSESVFLRPYEKGGFLSHKELHHVSIKVVPDVDAATFESSSRTTNASSAADRYKTEIKMDVDDDDAATEPPKIIPLPTRSIETLSDRPATTSNSTPPPPYPDCSVPIDDYPLKLRSVEPSKLQIHVDVTNVDLSDSFCKPIGSGGGGDDDDNDIDSVTRRQSRVRLPSGKYNNSKTAWNFLFQKLRDSYPRRQFLKLPPFQEPQTGGVYYSNLPDAIPAAVPCKREAPPRRDDALSDSDTSIADSLEDVQTHTKSNLYEKHDARLTRGEVSFDTEERYKRDTATHKGCGVAYFLPLEPRVDNSSASIKMPQRLEMKLKSRQRRLTKHDSCFDGGSKKVESSSKNENRWKRSRRKKHEYGDEPSSFRKRQMMTTRKLGSKTDEEIMHVLLDGLKVEDGVTAAASKRNDDGSTGSKRTAKMTTTRSVQTDRPVTEPNANRVVSEYNMETIKISSPAEEADHEVYEVVQSEEETARIDSTNYYRSVKKCRKIYCPMKKTFRSGSAFEGANCVRKFDGDQESSCVTNNLRNLRATKRAGKNRFRGGGCGGGSGGRQTTKMSNCRFRPFCQQFEAIPEEMTNGCQEKTTNREPPFGENSTSNGDSSKELLKNERIDKQATEMDANGNTSAAIETSQTYADETTNKRLKDEAKSQKGRDSLSLVNEHEELITLSKGWINFYLLDGNANVDENNEVEVENVCDEISTKTDTQRLSPLYTIHVHAKPEIKAQNTPPQTATTGTILPGIRNASPKSDDRKPTSSARSSKLSNGTNSLPGIRASATSRRSPRTTRSAVVSLEKTCDRVLPKLPDSNYGDERANEDNEKYERTNENDRRRMELMAATQHEPVSTFDSLESEKAASTTTITSSNQSESSVEQIRPCKKGRYKKLQKYHRPRTYQYNPIKRDNRWSLTIEGSEHDDKRTLAPNIEMQLSLKNSRTGTRSNQSWKFSITNEETSRTNDIEEYETNGRYLPHLNVNCKVPFPICYGDENIKYCEGNSRNNSALSFRRRSIVETCSDRRFSDISRFDSDLRLHKRSSEDNLTVIGSTITPERKPRVPTMSERDLYRMKLIKHSNTEII